MTFGLMTLGASILVLCGVLIGSALGERWLWVRAKRQAEIQRSLNRQWRELRAARHEDHFAGIS